MVEMILSFAHTEGLTWPAGLRWFCRIAASALVLAAVQSSIATGSPSTSAAAEPPDGTSAEGSFDAETVEELAGYFAVEAIRKARIPLAYRALSLIYGPIDKKGMIEEIEKNPPRIDDQGVVYPLGDKNQLSFVFNRKTRTLSCWERVVKKYGGTGMLGLTGPEMASALNASSSRTRDRGGADFAYDPIRDSLSLRIDVVHPPADRNEFFEPVDRLIKAVVKLEKKRYLQLAQAASKSALTPASATATTDGFTATLVLRHFSADPSDSEHWVERYLKTWNPDRQPGAMTPKFVSDRELLVDQIFHAYIHFAGARNSAGGIATVDATYRLIGPDGGQVFDKPHVPIWRERVHPLEHVHIGATDLSFSIDDEEPTGPYRLEATVCDTGTSRCVRLEHPFVLRAR
jgi:hypothetical protein